MKLFVVLLLVGVASASFLENESKKSTREVSDEWEKLKKSLKDKPDRPQKKLVRFLEEWANIIGEKGIPNAREHEKMKAYRK
ncbi:hypothetical protein TNIN_176671 [Trichonephila inaurata madagascariensis]|uniref:Uncharacterized protein n=1 Tax=Trichonephila inaurata madagascariensis TaxID=2747483 RepID=A0A8X6YNH8_9ARAC|nr:hypothetical protein TNIN_176671 [Trichonephila inaurata madagascariensis]